MVSPDLVEDINESEWRARSWDNVAGEWQIFASAVGSSPASGNPGKGIWGIAPSVQFFAGAFLFQPPPARQVDATITHVSWQPIELADGESNFDWFNPVDMGGGTRFIPGKNTPDGPTHRDVDVRVNVEPAELNLTVYLAIVDADDPTDADGPIDNDSAHSDGGDKDNLGIGASLNSTTLVTSQVNPLGYAYGERRFTSSLNPGDNYRIVAKPRNTGIGLVRPRYDQADPETLGREYYDANFNHTQDAAEEVFDEFGESKGAMVSPLLTNWRRLYVEVDSMEAPGNLNFPADDLLRGDIADPDLTFFADAFRPAFIEVVNMASLEDSPNSGSLPFKLFFANIEEMRAYFLGDGGHRGTRNEDSMFWTVYIAGVYELSESLSDNDPDSEEVVWGFTDAVEPEFSILPMETIRDVADQHHWTAEQTTRFQRLAALHEIGHQFLGGNTTGHDINNNQLFPGHIMTVHYSDATEAQLPLVNPVFKDENIRTIRMHGRIPTHP